MWKKKRGLWVFDENGRRTADRPHWLTLLTGFLSPALALAAVFISFQALRTSNRAWVAVVDGNLQFFNYGIVAHGDNYPDGQHCIVRMDLVTTIQNSGNSPASAGSLKPKYRLPKGWSEAPVWVKQNLGSDVVGIIGAKSTVTWSYTHLFELTPETYDAFRNFPLRQHFVYMDAAFNYKDVFGETSTAKWCWVAATNESKTQTTDCQSALKLVLGRGLPPELLRR